VFFVDRFLKKNAFILSPKEKERKQKEFEVRELQAKRDSVPKKASFFLLLLHFIFLKKSRYWNV
jgi:hypothetical protein